MDHAAEPAIVLDLDEPATPPDDGEDAGADDGADAQRRERPRAKRLLQPPLRLFRLGDQLVDRLLAKQLAIQVGFS